MTKTAPPAFWRGDSSRADGAEEAARKIPHPRGGGWNFTGVVARWRPIHDANGTNP